MFGHFKYTTKQKKIVTECISKNKQEHDKWFFHNLWYPVAIIFLSLILLLISTQDIDIVITKLLEGSLSLLGINVLFAMSSYLIRAKMYKQDELRNDVVNLSAKLGDWKTFLIVIGTILYVLPTLYHPSNYLGKAILFLVTFLVLILSISVSVRIFMIRDDFYKKTYDLEEADTIDKVIKKGSNEHGKTWDN